jgi:enoyl-CoA hydratase/carnithine racemase
MSWEHILLDKQNQIATITLNRPDKSNSFGGRMRIELLEAVEDAGSDPDVRVIVITGAGNDFCIGGDREEFFKGTSQASLKTTPSDRYTMHKVVLAINTIEKPFIAAVNGQASGGGVNLAMACDIRIASEKAKFTQSFVRAGFFPDWGAIYFLPRLVGYSKAAELLLTAETVNAAEALRIGMVNQVAPHEDLLRHTYEFAGKILKNAPVPITLIKRGLQSPDLEALQQALDFESYAIQVCRNTEDNKEGVKALVEKRPAVFKGF